MLIDKELAVIIENTNTLLPKDCSMLFHVHLNPNNCMDDLIPSQWKRIWCKCSTPERPYPMPQDPHANLLKLGVQSWGFKQNENCQKNCYNDWMKTSWRHFVRCIDAVESMFWSRKNELIQDALICYIDMCYNIGFTRGTAVIPWHIARSLPRYIKHWEDSIHGIYFELGKPNSDYNFPKEYEGMLNDCAPHEYIKSRYRRATIKDGNYFHWECMPTSTICVLHHMDIKIGRITPAIVERTLLAYKGNCNRK